MNRVIFTSALPRATVVLARRSIHSSPIGSKTATESVKDAAKTVRLSGRVLSITCLLTV